MAMSFRDLTSRVQDLASQPTELLSLLAQPLTQKYQWAVSTVMPKSDAEEFDSMFRAWDLDRAAGKAAAVGVTDETFGATVTTSAVFATMPTVVRYGPRMCLVSFGLTEV